MVEVEVDVVQRRQILVMVAEEMVQMVQGCQDPGLGGRVAVKIVVVEEMVEVGWR